MVRFRIEQARRTVWTNRTIWDGADCCVGGDDPMISYKNEVRIEVLTALGTVDVEYLDDAKKAADLDRRITRMAGRVLAKSEKTAFFFAYHCTPTWEEIQELFLSKLGRELKLDSVKRYGNDALLALKAAARNAPELKQ